MFKILISLIILFLFMSCSHYREHNINKHRSSNYISKSTHFEIENLLVGKLSEMQISYKNISGNSGRKIASISNFINWHNFVDGESKQYSKYIGMFLKRANLPKHYWIRYVIQYDYKKNYNQPEAWMLLYYNSPQDYKFLSINTFLH